ncbi:MAG: hypothetical protein A2288_00820 [Candidatus Moranbacteria bacterium RIFOXYA12_FULL_44_15]|nr:MAG: hypothetical protein A2288_00820 [Candidatus Moranbacteria bacterium RIFOXYA12_FULL_44_15]OGI35069.1 MAG: hypothetical protein A2259_04835 [Candidatus Moranbacteria bacterium RIFOXYA2_FULL_43_15]
MGNLVQSNLVFILLILTALSALILFWLTFLHVRLKSIQKRNLQLFSGEKTENLEDVLAKQAENIKALDKDIQELYTISNQINGLSFRGFHKIGLIRFNPFKEVGGDQSFSLALLNGKNNGLTISSLFTREGARIYAKSITAGKAEKYPLTKEEEEAIKTAMKPEFKK